MASVGFSNGVLVVTALMVVATLMLLTVFARLYRKAGPHEALVVYGFRGTRIVKGRGTIIFPMIENWHELSLELMSFDVAPQQDLYTRQGVAVTVEAVAQIKVKSDPESMRTAAEQFLTKSDEEREGLIRLVMEGHLRGIIGQLTVEEIVKQPEMVGDRMRATCADDMNKMGLEVISFTIKEVRDKNEYITKAAEAGHPRHGESAPPGEDAGRHRDRRRARPRAQAQGVRGAGGGVDAAGGAGGGQEAGRPGARRPRALAQLPPDGGELRAASGGPGGAGRAPEDGAPPARAEAGGGPGPQRRPDRAAPPRPRAAQDERRAGPDRQPLQRGGVPAHAGQGRPLRGCWRGGGRPGERQHRRPPGGARGAGAGGAAAGGDQGAAPSGVTIRARDVPRARGCGDSRRCGQDWSTRLTSPVLSNTRLR